MQIRGSNVAKWRQAVGMACLAALPGAAPVAGAFGLGHVVVLSALGQPLSANIEVTQIAASDAQSLKVGIAPGSLYQARKLSYSPALDGATISVRHDAHGRVYLHLEGTTPVQEPFVDLLLRAYWEHGELTRNYTLLLDPPGFHEPGVAPIAPQAAAPVAQAVRRTLPAPALHAAGVGSSYTVQRGDTLSSIARSYAGGQVSLEQMLAALYSANTRAFIDGDINRLRAGAVLQVPSANQADRLSDGEAHRIITAHSGDFGAYRRRLAELSPTQAGGNSRTMHGSVQAQVSGPDNGASAPQSRLKLSQAGVAAGGQAAEASWIAAQKQAQALSAKLAEARAEVAQLAQLAARASAAARAMRPGAAVAAASAASAAVSSAAAAAPTAAAPAAAHPNASAPTAATSVASVASVASAAAQAASQPQHAASRAAPAAAKAATPAKAPAVHVPAPAKPAEHAAPATRGLLRGLLANPLLAPAGLLIGLLLLGWAVLRRRRGSGGNDHASVFDSRMGGNDSFFGASGGERVDTHNSMLGSSMQYSPSQVESSVDVDPVAEADVYLAYGRDLQAEEILKEALKNHPDRNSARLKLLEIYVKRKDARSFELMAAELFTRTDGAGDDWKKAQELGRDLDPVNPLYHNTQPPSVVTGLTTVSGPEFDASHPVSIDPGPTVPPTELLAGLPKLPSMDESTAPGALDLVLDLSGVAAGASAAQAAQAAQAPHSELPDMGLDFDLSTLSGPTTQPPEPVAVPPLAQQPEALAQEPQSEPPTKEPAPLEFDLGSLSLHAPEELPHPTAAETPASGAVKGAGLDTRLALVEECRAIGDVDTARNLLHEILAESDGETRAQAEKLLAELGGGA